MFPLSFFSLSTLSLPPYIISPKSLPQNPTLHYFSTYKFISPTAYVSKTYRPPLLLYLL